MELVLLLRRSGYQVRAARNGVELLSILANWILNRRGPTPAEVLITDVRMPGFDGLNIVEGLIANGWTCPVIVMSAFADHSTYERVRRLRAVQFLEKPFDPAALERTIVQMT